MNDKTVFQKILVATDFSDSANSALAEATWLAKRLAAEVTVVHVIPFTDETLVSLAIYPWYLSADAGAIEQRLRGDSEDRLRDMVALHRADGVKMSYKTLHGSPLIEIIQLVEEEGFDLVVVGTHGLSAISRLLMGSTASKLVRKCPAPVLTVKQPRSEANTGTILAPVDFSEVSRKSLTLAAQLAANTAGALHVLHVYPADDAYAFALQEAEELDIAKKRRLQRRQTITLLRKFIAELALPVEPILRVERGEPWQWIVSTASSIGADITVMGTLGRGGIEGVLIGNTAEKVLHSSEGSVLAVKPDGFVSPVRPAHKAITA